MFTEKEVYDILNDVDHIDDAYMNMWEWTDRYKVNVTEHIKKVMSR